MRNRLAQGFAVMLLLSGGHVLAAESEAGFDCNLAKTAIETAICSDVSAREADANMAAAYRALRDALDPVARERLRREQLAWLKRRAAECAGPFNGPDLTIARCVGTMNYQRTEYLKWRQGRLTNTQSQQGPHLPPDQAYAICDEVEHLANEGTIQGRVIKFNKLSRQEEEIASLKAGGEINLRGLLSVTPPSGVTRRLALMGGGSCEGETIIDYDATISSGELVVGYQGMDADETDEFRWARWLMWDELLMVNGQPVVVTANFFASPTGIRLVSWFGSNRQTPLCAFRASGKVVLKTSQDAPPECQALVSGKVSVLPWAPATRQEATTQIVGYNHYRGGPPELVATASADLNGDGKTDRVGLLRLDSAAGCGGVTEFLSHVGEEGRLESQSPLSKALGEHAWGPTYPHRVETEKGRLSLFTYQQRAYILGKHDDQLGVFYIQGDQLRKSCQLEVLPQIEVEQSYIPR